MPQFVGQRANLLARISIPGLLILVALALALLFWFLGSPFATGEGDTPTQPLLFSHALHAGDLAMDCRYCHTSVEESAFAGMPPSQTCMNCHSQLLTRSPLLEPLRESWERGDPIHWVRVNDLADFVYFNHAAHVTNGVGCATCHGEVDEMEQVEQVAPLTMGWCLDCHRDPGEFLRPPDRVFDMDWERPDDHEALEQMLVEQLGVESLTSCSTCHR